MVHKKFIYFLLFIISVNYSFGQDEELRKLIKDSGCSKEYAGSHSLVLFDSTIADIQDNGLSKVRIRTLTKILTEEGTKENNIVTFPYDPLSAKIEIKRVRVFKSDGNILELSNDRFYDYPAPARMIYWGAREKAAAIGKLEVGDAIDVEFIRTGFTYALLYDDDERFVPPMRGHFYDIVNFWSNIPILEKVYKIYMPADKPLQYEVYNGELNSYVHFPTKVKTKHLVKVNPNVKMASNNYDLSAENKYEITDKTIYGFSKKNILPFKSEPNMVAASDVACKLLLSTSEDWYAKSVWFYGVNEDFGSFEYTPEIKELTDKLLEGVSDEIEKIKILTHWAAEEIRYSGISMGEGEGYTLHKGEMTFADRCGVCKDKAGMLITMLRAAGFESYAAMTMAGSRIDRIPADQFNHSVTVAKLSDGTWILLDPTWVPGVRELWSSAEQQQEFLMGLPGGADLMTTPISPPENHYWKLDIRSSIDSQGNLNSDIELSADGQSDAMLRRALRSTYKSNANVYFDRLILKKFPNAQIIKKEYHNPDDLSKPMLIKLSIQVPDFAILTDKSISFKALSADSPFDDSYNAPELSTDISQEEKEYGFRMRCSKLVQITEIIKLPKKYKETNFNDFKKIDTGSASFSATYKSQGNEIKIEMEHIMPKRLYEPTDWFDFKMALSERKAFMNSQLVLSN